MADLSVEWDVGEVLPARRRSVRSDVVYSEAPSADDVGTLSDEEIERICIRNLLAATDEVIYFKDLQSRFVRVSDGMARLHPGSLIGLTDFDVFGAEHASLAYADEQRIIATGVPIVNNEERETWTNRADTWVASTKLPLRDLDGTIIGTFGISRDISRLVHSQELATQNARALTDALDVLHRTEAELRTVLDISPEAISKYGPDLRYQYVNPAAERLIHATADEVLNRSDRELGREETFLAMWEIGLISVLDTGAACVVEFSAGEAEDARWFQTQMAPELDADGTVLAVLTSTRELTALKRAERALEHQALHDPVTGLANRVLLMDRLAEALPRLERQPGQVAVLFIDLDHFKEINDSLGHDAGDRMLVEVARRLARVSRRIDTVARFGGDEFVVLCDQLRADEDVRMVADRLVRTLFEPFDDGGRELHITGSIGIAVTSDPSADPGDLVRDADAAMYQAKEHGRNRFQFFDAELRERAAAKHTMEAELRRAITRGEFRVYYQPLFSMADTTILGVEALIRWQHPERGIVSPLDFIGVAEDRGLMVQIGTWVLDQACEQLAIWNAWRDPSLPPLTVAVNVSGGQLREPDFAAKVCAALERNNIAPAQLCLEITETVLLQEAIEAADSLETLSQLGVHIALDDFGTGYSSIAHLRNFPVDILKIDRSFVDRLSQSDRERKLIAAMTAMAHALGMTVVGEGIETPEQLSGLKELECDNGQGFLVSHPLPADEATRLLAAQPGPATSAVVAVSGRSRELPPTLIV
jgi:diguanylate cyclase (GGDEF)-like protein/PAS domain S-box-containing protein